VTEHSFLAYQMCARGYSIYLLFLVIIFSFDMLKVELHNIDHMI